QTESYSYTPNGSLTSKTDRNGTDFTYGVDGLGRTLTINASKSAATQTHTTAYNYGGQVSSVSADGVTTSYTYDGYGRVVLELNLVTLGASGIPSQKAYTYDLSGRMLTSAITVNGVTNTTSYTYDRLGRVVTVKENGETEATYTYDANGNRATMTLGNGEVTTYTYNLANMVKTLVNKDESNNTLSSCSYLYRLDGNQVGKQEGTKTTLYAYDDLGRLTAEAVTENQTTVTTGYSFDVYNNRATKTIGGVTVTTYTYDSNNRLTGETGVAGNTTYTYDDNGSQLIATIGTSTTTNTYDLFGQLKSYTGMDSVVTNYTYGPDGLRVSKASGNTSTAYVWDGGNITNEFISTTEGENTTTTENRYVYGIGRIKAFLDTTEVYYLYNAHGDVTGLTDSSCDLTKSYIYDAFGIEANPDPADANPFRYCGEYFDKETETYYLRARYYKPSTGRFTQQDPANDGLNWYVYCNNNSVSFVDPSGCTALPNRLPEDDIEFDKLLMDLQNQQINPALDAVVFGNEFYNSPLFDTIEEAAMFFAENAMALSLFLMIEFHTTIYSIIDDVLKYGIIGFQFGTAHAIDEVWKVPTGTSIVAFAHTHPNGKDFSTPDRDFADLNRKILFVATPELKLLKYDFETKETTEVDDFIPNKLPIFVSKKSFYLQFEEYFRDHIKDKFCEYGYDCVNMEWPNWAAYYKFRRPYYRIQRGYTA
ncbi:MAG TPA: RHS repeat-associated core domain-containing protein, partial [Oscillospiraceae bacterium]|nr:RHS repeat-associated core domain-containing protein [Oscillospiraceae bacterium]HPS34987.1 RHS repeat-associated core domain-containing protein [Oscillospiraceae bacterium]